MQSTLFFDILTTILQPKGGCDIAVTSSSSSHHAHNHPSAERRLRHGPAVAVGDEGGSQPSFSRKAVATPHPAREEGRPSHNHPSAERRLRQLVMGNPPIHETHNHPSAERRLRQLDVSTLTLDGFSQPSFSRKAVATCVRGRRGWSPRSQPSFSRKAVATCCLRAWLLLLLAHNHPSAERRLRHRESVKLRIDYTSQPSFSRKAVATCSRSNRRSRTPLTTILQPKGGCDEALMGYPIGHTTHNHPSAERRLRQELRESRALVPSHNHPSAERRLRLGGRRGRGCAGSHNHPSAERRLRHAGRHPCW